MSDLSLAALQEIVGPDNVLTEKSLPTVYPSTVEEVSKLMALANQATLPVFTETKRNIPAVTATNGIMLAFSRMSSVIEVDTANLVATIEPGATVSQLNQAVETSGLMYPLDPGRGTAMTFGEIVAENAGGIRGLKYGATKHYIMGLEIVLADGRILKTGGKNVKDVSGYDLTKLITGSKNTLAVITKITVKLMPAPEEQRYLTAAFSTIDEAAKAVSAILTAKIIPSALEIMDSVTIKALAGAGFHGLPSAGAAVVMLELDGVSAAVEKAAIKATEILTNCGAGAIQTAQTAQERDALWTSRQNAAAALTAAKSAALPMDITVARSQLSAAVNTVEKIAREQSIAIGVFGHAGEGNLFPVISFNAEDETEANHAQQAQQDIFQAIRQLGGSINGEPNVLKIQYGPASMAAMLTVKRSLDPNGILNPGTLMGE